MLTVKAVVNAFDKGKSKAFVLTSSGKLRVGIDPKVNTKRSHLFASHDLYVTVTTYMWRCFEEKKKKGCNKSWMKTWKEIS